MPEDALAAKERIRVLLTDIQTRSAIALHHFDRAPGQVADNCACIQMSANEIMLIFLDASINGRTNIVRTLQEGDKLTP